MCVIITFQICFYIPSMTERNILIRVYTGSAVSPQGRCFDPALSMSARQIRIPYQHPGAIFLLHHRH